MLSCKEPGGLFAICELGNAPLFGAFPDRARALPRETVARHPKLASVPCRRGCFILIIGASLRGPQKKTKYFFGVGLGELACRPKVYRGGKTEGVIAGVSQFPLPPSLREVPRRGGRSKKTSFPICRRKRLFAGKSRNAAVFVLKDKDCRNVCVIGNINN